MSRKYHLLNKFGISEEQYDDLLRNQNGCCAVCKRPAEVFKSKLAVDHDHFTGHIRGLLCVHCNRYVIGRYRKGNGEEKLLAAFHYLTAEYPGWIVPPRKKRKKRRAKRLSKHLKLRRTRRPKLPDVHQPARENL